VSFGGGRRRGGRDAAQNEGRGRADLIHDALLRLEVRRPTDERRVPDLQQQVRQRRLVLGRRIGRGVGVTEAALSAHGRNHQARQAPVVSSDVAGDLGLARGHGANDGAREIRLLAEGLRRDVEERHHAIARRCALGRRVLHPPFEGAGLALEGRAQEAFLAAKPAVQRAQRDAGLRRHVALPHVVEATFLGELDRDVQDAILTLGLRARPRRPGARLRLRLAGLGRGPRGLGHESRSMIVTLA
jgi:hypothetical protein